MSLLNSGENWFKIKIKNLGSFLWNLITDNKLLETQIHWLHVKALICFTIHCLSTVYRKIHVHISILPISLCSSDINLHKWNGIWWICTAFDGPVWPCPPLSLPHFHFSIPSYVLLILFFSYFFSFLSFLISLWFNLPTPSRLQPPPPLPPQFPHCTF